MSDTWHLRSYCLRIPPALEGGQAAAWAEVAGLFKKIAPPGTEVRIPKSFDSSDTDASYLDRTAPEDVARYQSLAPQQSQGIAEALESYAQKPLSYVIRIAHLRRGNNPDENLDVYFHNDALIVEHWWRKRDGTASVEKAEPSLFESALLFGKSDWIVTYGAGQEAIETQLCENLGYRLPGRFYDIGAGSLAPGGKNGFGLWVLRIPEEKADAGTRWLTQERPGFEMWLQKTAANSRAAGPRHELHRECAGMQEGIKKAQADLPKILLGFDEKSGSPSFLSRFKVSTRLHERHIQLAHRGVLLQALVGKLRSRELELGHAADRAVKASEDFGSDPALVREVRLRSDALLSNLRWELAYAKSVTEQLDRLLPEYRALISTTDSYFQRVFTLTAIVFSVTGLIALFDRNIVVHPTGIDRDAILKLGVLGLLTVVATLVILSVAASRLRSLSNGLTELEESEAPPSPDMRDHLGRLSAPAPVTDSGLRLNSGNGIQP